MATLTIEGRSVTVDDAFLSLSPEEQNQTVEEIAQSLGVSGGVGSDEPEAPELTAGRVAGLAGRAGVQAIPGAIAGLPALAYDGTVGFLENMTRQAYNFGARALGAEELPYRDPFKMTNAVTALGEAGADALGLTKPETEGERIAVAGGQTALEALSGAGLAKAGAKTVEGGARRVLTELADAPKTQAAIGALAGGGAQTAVESDVNPLVGMGLGLGVGLGGVAAVDTARAVGQAGRRAYNRALVRGDDVREQLARERLYNAASDPEAALRELDEGAGAELVPGSHPTTFQATGDMGLGSLERELQTANPGAFAQRRADQNAARLDSLRSAQGDGVVSDTVNFLRGQLDEIDGVMLRAEDDARSAAQDAVERFRPGDSVDAIGGRLQDRMSDAEKVARAHESRLWDAIDPSGTLTVSTSGLKQKIGEVYGNLTQAAKAGLSKDEQTFLGLVSGYSPATPLRELVDLRKSILEASRNEMKFKGRTQAWARLAQLNQAVRSSIENTAAEVVSADPATAGRVRAYANEWRPSTDSGVGASPVRARAIRPGGVSGVAGAPRQAEGGIGYAAGNQGRQSQTGRGKPLSLIQFIAKNGGLPLDAESAARDWGNVSIGRFGKLARRDGRSIDGYWRNKLIEEGYLPPDADGYASRDITKELYDAIEHEQAGRKTFTAADEMQGQSGFELDGPEAELHAASRQIREELQSFGVRPEDMSSRAMNEAAELLARGEEQDAITAYERAVMNLDDEGPVVAQYVPRSGASAASGQTIFDTFRNDPEAGQRYKAATEATRTRIGTYNKGYAGEILRRAEERDGFRMAPSSVAANAFKPGHTGGERIKAIVRAGGSMSDISEIAALSLWKHVKDGTLDPKKFEVWRKAHAAALSELPQDVRARFATASLATQTLEKVAAARKTRMNQLNKSVLGRIANIEVEDLPREMGKILGGSDSFAKMSTLTRAISKDQNAKEGLRRAVAEHIMNRFISNKEVGTSGENGIQANAFANFMRDNKRALQLVFKGEDLVRLQAIVDDIRRAERSLYAIRTPGQSNSPQDLLPFLEKATKDAAKKSIMGQVVEAGRTGLMAGGVKGAAISASGALAKAPVMWLAGSIRAAGLKKVDDLVLEAMLNPELGKFMLMKAPLTNKGTQSALGAKLARLSPLAVTSAAGGSYER